LAGAIVKKGGKSIQQESDDWVNKHGKLVISFSFIPFLLLLLLFFHSN